MGYEPLLEHGGKINYGQAIYGFARILASEAFREHQVKSFRVKGMEFEVGGSWDLDFCLTTRQFIPMLKGVKIPSGLKGAESSIGIHTFASEETKRKLGMPKQVLDDSLVMQTHLNYLPVERNGNIYTTDLRLRGNARRNYQEWTERLVEAARSCFR